MKEFKYIIFYLVFNYGSGSTSHKVTVPTVPVPVPVPQLCIWKVTDENSRIRIRIHESEAWTRGSGSVQKCHGTATQPLKPY
jgi:hypothetical protein